MGDSSIQANQIKALEAKLNEIIRYLNLLLSGNILVSSFYKVEKIDLHDLD